MIRCIRTFLNLEKIRNSVISELPPTVEDREISRKICTDKESGGVYEINDVIKCHAKYINILNLEMYNLNDDVIRLFSVKVSALSIDVIKFPV
jgi:hypothetical protein